MNYIDLNNELAPDKEVRVLDIGVYWRCWTALHFSCVLRQLLNATQKMTLSKTDQVIYDRWKQTFTNP